MWAGILLGVGVYALFGLFPAALNVLVSFTNYALYPGAPVNWQACRTTSRCSRPSSPECSHR